MKRTLVFLIVLSTLSLSAQEYTSKYFKHLVFRETPYSQVKGRIPITKERIINENHYKLSYDEYDRLVLIEYRYGNQQISRRRAGILDGFRNIYSKTVINYKDNQEVWTFYDAKNVQRKNLMNVYKEIYTLNNLGKRVSVKYYDENDKLVDNNWNIAEYIWQHTNDYDIIEKRKNTKGDYVSMRPYYHFIITLYKYTKQGLLISMSHINEDGLLINDYEDATGIAIDKAEYDDKLNLIGFKFYNSNEEPTVGSFLESAGGIINYDANGNCIYYSTINLDDSLMLSRGKAYDIHKFDDYGNSIESASYGLNNEPVEYRGYSKIKYIYNANDPSKKGKIKRFQLKQN